MIKTKNTKKVYAVAVLRKRDRKVASTSLSWRPLNDPIEPTNLPCTQIHTASSATQTVVSVPKSCLTKTGPNKTIKAKVRLTDGTRDLDGTYFDEGTRYLTYLKRAGGPSADGPRGQVIARGGLVVRSLPTTFSHRRGKLENQEVYPLSCQVAGTVVYRNNDQDSGAHGLWIPVHHVSVDGTVPPLHRMSPARRTSPAVSTTADHDATITTP